MRRSRPLQDHPEFSLIDCPSWREYRVESVPVSQHGTSRLRTLLRWYWVDALVVPAVAYAWPEVTSRPVSLAVMFAALLCYTYMRCNQVLWESVIVLPSLGLQFETHRGLPQMPLFISRRFMPFFTLQDFIINEGLHGWDVRYYLAAIQRSQHGAITLEIAFENLLPRFPVLLEVYHGVHEMVFTNSRGTDGMNSNKS
ncbi:uncharacterized protein LAESUDRAFT_740811 [Laetiporus sulphureus 93-53]|uniref:Phosphatidylinositol N-acetylglucosaminyltransferase subunit H conserved domain-containing protein n=1 Tax=Laetiporus sulphureus 93-53 TaxID=1314785 RepID=A0A165H5A0_9APHY|nr:uncharacterized protein LAESUDRAFT_740811 [Laetiporus sulphureus 93-53]KZT11261.1 hypothetical protein LAESUDRAFT_740811 [Laetiporus sulphureus 93-53]